jgi:hypothetical protein
MRGAIPPLTHKSSWRGAELSKGHVLTTWDLVRHRDNFTFTTTFSPLTVGIPVTLLYSRNALCLRTK